MSDLDNHCALVIKAVRHGRLVPFLGAGANLCDRPESVSWRPEQHEYLPLGGELAHHLAREFRYPEEPNDLARVSQYAAVMTGLGLLYDELHTLFDSDYPCTQLHAFLAALPAFLRQHVHPSSNDPLKRRLVVVTTNYDDLLERAFHERGEEFHVVSYDASESNASRFIHWKPSGWPPADDPIPIVEPNKYRGFPESDTRPVILKIHGGLDRAMAARDSFVITEDDYIGYLAQSKVENLIPMPVLAKLAMGNFLFLGYSLRDWNLRVFLHRIWGQRKFTRSWAIQVHPDQVDQEFWRQRNVDIIDARLSDYVAALNRALAQVDGGPRRD